MILMLLITAALATLTGTAHARTFHYACNSGESRYALTVNTNLGIVKLRDHGPPFKLVTFRILKEPGDGCADAKYGWDLNAAKFCTATQGSGTLYWNGREIQCDQADTD